ncbi:asparagine-rich protein-like [Prorops nasuta]|uniref:asparagine-rich protein-like n=1 Tax=Prorops nasuta TaxID=863751 RepID=UPI0034CFF0F5
MTNKGQFNYENLPSANISTRSYENATSLTHTQKLNKDYDVATKKATNKQLIDNQNINNVNAEVDHFIEPTIDCHIFINNKGLHNITSNIGNTEKENSLSASIVTDTFSERSTLNNNMFNEELIGFGSLNKENFSSSATNNNFPENDYPLRDNFQYYAQNDASISTKCNYQNNNYTRNANCAHYKKCQNHIDVENTESNGSEISVKSLVCDENNMDNFIKQLGKSLPYNVTKRDIGFQQMLLAAMRYSYNLANNEELNVANVEISEQYFKPGPSMV